MNRCVCHQVTFKELVELSKSHHLSLDQLSERTGCCTGCAGCRPYVRLALATGRTEFPPMPPAQLEALIREANEAGEDSPESPSG